MREARRKKINSANAVSVVQTDSEYSAPGRGGPERRMKTAMERHAFVQRDPGLSLLLNFVAYKLLEILKSLKRSRSASATRCNRTRNPATLSALLMGAKRTLRIRERPKVILLH
jgi:hypothetical protein